MQFTHSHSTFAPRPNFHRGNYDDFSNVLSKIDTNDCDVYTDWNTLSESLMECIAEFVPVSCACP